MSSPAISVIMPAYNGGALIEETIASVLAQTFTDFELIVVDDASSDDTLARLRAIADPRVVVIASDRNGGPVFARNLAFAAARGEYIVGLDQDDLCHPERFTMQLGFMQSNPGVVLVASAVRFLDTGAILPPRQPLVTSPAMIAWRLQLGNPLVWSSVMFRAEAARRLAVFERADRLFAEDFDLYHRLARFGAIARIDMPLVTYRIHPGGASKRFTRHMQKSATAVLAEHYAPLFGDGADQAADLILNHFAACAPVPDVATLHRMNAAIDRVHNHFLATHSLSERDHRLIMDEYARLWWQFGDACIRSGSLGSEVIAADRPPTLRQGVIPRHRWMTSQVIGRARAFVHRLRPSTDA